MSVVIIRKLFVVRPRPRQLSRVRRDPYAATRTRRSVIITLIIVVFITNIGRVVLCAYVYQTKSSFDVDTPDNVIVVSRVLQTCLSGRFNVGRPRTIKPNDRGKSNAGPAPSARWADAVYKETT